MFRLRCVQLFVLYLFDESDEQWQPDDPRTRRHSQLPGSTYFDPQATSSVPGMDQAAMM